MVYVRRNDMEQEKLQVEIGATEPVFSLFSNDGNHNE
jgi:hypothetical protein